LPVAGGCIAALLWAGVLAAPRAVAAPAAVAEPAAARPQRPVVLVPTPAEACWQDMAYLAAVPAMTKAGEGAPAVIALSAGGEVTREVADYLRRYKPGQVYLLGSRAKKAAGLGRDHKVLRAGSADAAACALARTFWTTSDTAVVCGADDYTGALVGAALAARLRAPLLFAGEKGLSKATDRTLKGLGANRVLRVGSAAAATAKKLKARKIAVTELADAKAVLAWMRKQKMPVTYLAAVNPNDRAGTVTPKLSLAGALLAAGREGMVAPLPYDVRWKVSFPAEPITEPGATKPATRKAPKPAARKAPKTPPGPRKGVIRLDGREYPFQLAAISVRNSGRLTVDVNGNGRFNDAGEGPFATGDVLALGARRYAVTLRQWRRRDGLWLTSPTAEEVNADLRAYYTAAGGAPKHLCIVGFPDAIPPAIVANSPSNPLDMISDQPYTNTDDDLFAEIGVGRVIAESAAAATLYASRAITYEQLLDASWGRNVGEARWENTYTRLFENVGFAKSYRHRIDDLKWRVPPAEGVRGKRARDIDADSPLTHAAAIVHMAHSWWRDLGGTFSWDSPTLLAPAMVESGGCLTAAMDSDPKFRSVVSRLLRNGAVGFVGNSRPGIAHQEQLRMEFWNTVLAGETIGTAHRKALTSMAVRILETGQKVQGPDRYQFYIRMLFGDPAVKLCVPTAPRSAPARVSVAGDVVSVHAPAAWWPVKMHVPADWKKWADKDLYVCRGAGTYALRSWCGEQYDREITCFNAELHTTRRVKAIREVSSPGKPLGWSGKYFVDEHADGTRTYRWRVQLIDFNQLTGKITAKADRVDYRIEWE